MRLLFVLFLSVLFNAVLAKNGITVSTTDWWILNLLANAFQFSFVIR